MTENPSTHPSTRAAATSGAASTLARARSEHATPTPQAGDLWRARWNTQAGVLLVLASTPDRLRVAPVSLDTEPDDSAVHSPFTTNTLGMDLAVWISDQADVPLRVLDYQLGALTTDLGALAAGTVNWGPTDPRTLARARLQDLTETLQNAEWVTTSSSTLDLRAVLAAADLRDVVNALGSPAQAAALRDGQMDLTPDAAARLADVLHLPARELIAASRPPLPDDLVTAMDSPNVRSLVGRLAARRDAEETETWRTAAYGVLSLSARDHDRRDTSWTGRIRAYFDSHLRDDTGPDQ